MKYIKAVSVFSIITAAILVHQACGRGFIVKNPGTELASLSPELPASVASGKTLYQNNCMGCHSDINGLPAKQGRTLTQITEAMRVVAAMSSNAVLQKLSSEELQSIADFLNYRPSCSTSMIPKRVAARLLSNEEYDNSVYDLLAVNSSASSTYKFESLPAGTSGFTKDSSYLELTSLMVEKYWAAAEGIAEGVIANKSQSGSAYSRIASCAVGLSSVPDTCIDSIIRNFGLKVWRRPVSESTANNEFARLKTIFKAPGSFDNGLRDFIKALLISPNFLMVVIPNPSNVGAGQSFQLDPFQLASRLSFFLWQSTPDDELLNLAKAGTLTANLDAQVNRMLKDQRGLRLAKILSQEWLNLQKIPRLGITSLDSSLLSAMTTETQLMFQDIVANNLSLSRAFTADYSFMNQVLANYYGVPFSGTNPNQFYKISVAETPRRGVLGQAAFLIATSGSPLETHPVMRGKEVATRIACYEIGPPPPGASTDTPKDLPPDAIPAEMLEAHTQRTQCASCHNTLDPYGLPLEAFDSKGVYRTTYTQLGNRMIPQNGTLISGESFQTVKDYLDVIGGSPKVKSCISQKVLSLAVVRNANTPEDGCVADSIGSSSLRPDSKFSDFILQIIKTKQFTSQTVE